MYDSEVLEYWGKTCRFYKRSKLGYFAFKNGQRTGSSFMLNSKLWRHVGAKSLFTFIPFLPPKRIVEREKHV